MNQPNLLEWLYADIDEIIDFDGYDKPLEEKNNERKQHPTTCPDNGGPVCNDSG